MGLRRVFKKAFSFGFQPKQWIGIDHVKKNGKIVSDLAKDLVTDKEKLAQRIKTQTQTNSFNTDDSKQRKSIALKLTFLYVFLMLGFIGYALYFLVHKNLFLAGVVSFAIACLLASYGLREFILYAQLRLQRNQIRLKELFKFFIKGFPE